MKGNFSVSSKVTDVYTLLLSNTTLGNLAHRSVYMDRHIHKVYKVVVFLIISLFVINCKCIHHCEIGYINYGTSMRPKGSEVVRNNDQDTL